MNRASRKLKRTEKEEKCEKIRIKRIRIIRKIRTYTFIPVVTLGHLIIDKRKRWLKTKIDEHKCASVDWLVEWRHCWRAGGLGAIGAGTRVRTGRSWDWLIDWLKFCLLCSVYFNFIKLLIFVCGLVLLLLKHIHTRTHICTYTHIRTYKHTYTHPHIRTYKQIHTHIYITIYIKI